MVRTRRTFSLIPAVAIVAFLLVGAWSPSTVLGKVVVVIHASKRPASHRVAKMPRTVVRHNPAPESLPDSEVPASPRDLIVEFQQTVSAPTDGSFAGSDRGLRMQLDAPGQIETSLSRGGDGGRELDAGH